MKKRKGEIESCRSACKNVNLSKRSLDARTSAGKGSVKLEARWMAAESNEKYASKATTVHDKTQERDGNSGDGDKESKDQEEGIVEEEEEDELTEHQFLNNSRSEGEEEGTAS